MAVKDPSIKQSSNINDDQDFPTDPDGYTMEEEEEDDEYVQKILRFLKQPQESWTQRRTNAWKVWREECLPQIQSWFARSRATRTQYPATTVEMEHMLKQLDEIFFDGMVNQFCSFKWFNDPHSIGDAELMSQPNEPKNVQIRVNTANVNNAQRLIGMMLHEMSHAYITLYGCRTCCPRGQDCERQWLDVGETGHGPHWYRLATGVEKSACTLHGETIKLNILRGISREWEEGMLEDLASERLWDTLTTEDKVLFKEDFKSTYMGYGLNFRD